MSKKKMTPAQKAAARRDPAAEQAPKAIEKKERVAPGRNLESKYEKRTKKIITTVQIVLVIIPFALVGFAWFMNGGTTAGLEDAMAKDPQLTIGFISAMCQALVAWLLRFVQRHYEEGDGGYAAANLIGLVCGEIMLQNAVGIVGCALILWRIWKRIPGELTAWRQERKIGGMLADISGALLICFFGAVCAFATWRIS